METIQLESSGKLGNLSFLHVFKRDTDVAPALEDPQKTKLSASFQVRAYLMILWAAYWWRERN